MLVVVWYTRKDVGDDHFYEFFDMDSCLVDSE